MFVLKVSMNFELVFLIFKMLNFFSIKSTDTNILKKAYSFNLYVNVKNFVCRIGENANILLTLYDAKEGSFIRYNVNFLFIVDGIHSILLPSLI